LKFIRNLKFNAWRRIWWGF